MKQDPVIEVVHRVSSDSGNALVRVHWELTVLLFYHSRLPVNIEMAPCSEAVWSRSFAEGYSSPSWWHRSS